MNKSDVIAAMAEKADISKKQAEQALAGFQEALIASVIDDGKFSLPGVGIFTKKARKASKGVMKGVEWTKPAHNTVTFKAASAFKAAVE